MNLPTIVTIIFQLIFGDNMLKVQLGFLIKKHKPVCIFKKGAFVVDDVGGMHVYADFVSIIYEADDKEEKEQYRTWAEGQRWSNRNVP